MTIKHNFDSNYNIEQLEKLGVNNLANLVAEIQTYHLNEINNSDPESKKERLHSKSINMIDELIEKYQQTMTYKRNRIIGAILDEEREYCFNTDYCSDVEWGLRNGRLTREQSYNRIEEFWIEQKIKNDDDFLCVVREYYGDRFDWIFLNEKATVITDKNKNDWLIEE